MEIKRQDSLFETELEHTQNISTAAYFFLKRYSIKSFEDLIIFSEGNFSKAVGMPIIIKEELNELIKKIENQAEEGSK
ncbi:MAG: hypothetical protein RSB67_02680 [Clostridia bacterium]